jgi:hypothetical protein
VKHTLKYIFLLFYFFFSLQLFSQWINDAYINDFKVNNDATVQEQRNSKIGADSSGNFVIAWNDDRNFTNNLWHQLYCQIFDKWGSPVGNNFRIGQDTTNLVDIAVLSDGRFIVYWINYYIFGIGRKYELCFQRFDKAGLPLTPILKVVDTNYSHSTFTFQGGGIGTDSIGNFIICWSRGVSVSPSLANVFTQRFDSSGNKIGLIDTANSTNDRALNPSIAANKDGSYLICWDDDRLNSFSTNRFDIFMQRYNSNGIKIGNNVKVNDDTDSTVNQYYPSISSDGNGKFAISWIDGRIMFEDNVYYQFYDTSANPVGPNKLASSMSSGFSVSSPVCAMRSDGYFFIGWSDGSTGPRKYFGRRYDSNGEPYGNPPGPYVIPVNSLPVVQDCNDAFISGDRIYASWMDTRQGNYDIYCNVRSFLNPDSVIIGLKNLTGYEPVDFKLYPAIPNPFNPETKIKYQIPKNSFIKLTVFDITGKESALLYEGYKQKGTYEITFDGSNYSSGVYFVYLSSESTLKSVQKIILLK